MTGRRRAWKNANTSIGRVADAIAIAVALVRAEIAGVIDSIEILVVTDRDAGRIGLGLPEADPPTGGE